MNSDCVWDKQTSVWGGGWNGMEWMCLDSRRLCLPVEQLEGTSCSLVRERSPASKTRTQRPNGIISWDHHPFTGGRCNASIGCNARSLTLDFKSLFYSKMNPYFLQLKEIRSDQKNWPATKQQSEKHIVSQPHDFA